MQVRHFSTARFSTAICEIKWPCKNTGKFFIAGSVPGTCGNERGDASKIYDTEEEALTAILADPWIQANPGQTIQRADCSKVQR